MGIRQSLMGIGARPTDRPDERLRKGALVLTAVMITVLATVWTATYLLLGRPLSAAVPLAYQVISVVGLAYIARTANFRPFYLSQLISMLILPFALQWSLGGFVNSSAMMVWAFSSPLGALVLLGGRRALVFFGGFLALTLLSGMIDPWLSAGAAPVPEGLRLAFFVLNLSATSLVTYAVLQYFVSARERALAETDALLHNILPMQIADRLKAGEDQIADDFESVAVVFADVVGFTGIAQTTAAADVVGMLERLFSSFDALADRYGLEKVKTIGDAYMAVAGAPAAHADPVGAAAEMSLAMVAEAARVGAELGRDVQVRVGLHTGPASAGVIGRRKFFYDLWGDAVNLASRMESHGVAGRVHASAAVEDALRGEYLFEERGTIEVKGLGTMSTYFLVGKRN